MNGQKKSQEVILLAIVTLFWFGQYVYIPYQTPYLTASGVASSMIGTIVGAYGITQLILRFPVGLCADTLGRHRPFILIGGLSCGCASLLRVLLGNGTGFLLANLLSGLAASTWISFMVFYTQKYSPENQQKATSRVILFNNLGMLLGFVISTLFYARIGMKSICLLSVFSGIGVALLSLLLQEPPLSRPAVKPAQLIQVCRGKRILIFSFLALIQQGIQLSTTMSFTNQILKDCGATDLTVGLSSIIYMLFAVLFAAFASSSLCTRKGPRFWIPLMCVFIAVYCALVPRVNSIPGILTLQIFPGMATGILFTYATSEAMKGVPAEKKSTAMGFFQAFYAIGMTAFPTLTGHIASAVSMKTAYLVLAFIALAGCAVSLLYYRTAAN